jgi:hypothetical protein
MSLPSHGKENGETIVVNETVPAPRNVFLTPKVLRRILLWLNSQKRLISLLAVFF